MESRPDQVRKRAPTLYAIIGLKLLKWLLFKGKPTEDLQISDTIHSG